MLMPLLSIVLMASAGGAQTLQNLDRWAQGPVKWLLLSEERKEMRQLETDDAAELFIQRFWERREFASDRAGKPFRESFGNHVEAADVLYGEGETRGSLTDRGRALILLGPPAHVSVSVEPGLAWEAGTATSQQVTTRRINIEEWGYRMEALPEGTLQLWMSKKKAEEGPLALTLTFRSQADHTVLVAGEPLLETAARALVRNPLSD